MGRTQFGRSKGGRTVFSLFSFEFRGLMTDTGVDAVEVHIEIGVARSWEIGDGWL